mgnify:CR=1 FL=1
MVLTLTGAFHTPHEYNFVTALELGVAYPQQGIEGRIPVGKVVALDAAGQAELPETAEPVALPTRDRPTVRRLSRPCAGKTMPQHN